MRNSIIGLFYFLFVASGVTAQQAEKINLGPQVNSKFDEGHPVLSADGRELYFWRSLYRQSAGKEVQSAWYSRQDSAGKWLPAKYMGKPFNYGTDNSGIFNISPDNNTILLRGYYKNGERVGKGFSFVQRGLSGWKDPRGIDIPGYNELAHGNYSGAFLLPDGKGIIFYLSEVENSSLSDLYISLKSESGAFSKPVYISSLNTKEFDESTPFLASDNKTLYFSSDRPGGQGDQDIWKTTRLDDTWLKWSEPVNLGPAINTKGWDAYFFIDARGEFAYMITSTETGKMDIVKVKLEAESKPEPVVLVRGQVLNKTTNKPVEAVIQYENLANGNNEGVATSDPLTGAYQIALPFGRNYGFSASAENFLAVSENLDLSKIAEYKEMEVNLYLVPIEKGQVVRINNIFFESGSAQLRNESFPELDRLVDFMNKNLKVRIQVSGHTDNVGSDEANLKLSKDRAMAVKSYLVSKQITESRIESEGYGETKPVVPNDTDENKLMNRRVEFVILDL
jgi:outer membrane protein OmpA-like peptidoglycan-associated protein